MYCFYYNSWISYKIDVVQENFFVGYFCKLHYSNFIWILFLGIIFRFVKKIPDFPLWFSSAQFVFKKCFLVVVCQKTFRVRSKKLWFKEIDKPRKYFNPCFRLTCFKGFGSFKIVITYFSQFSIKTLFTAGHFIW